MKKAVLFLLFALSALTVSAQDIKEIKWMTFDEATALQKVNPKPIFMDVYTDWCGPCKMLDKNTFHNIEIVNYVNENYYAVKFNAEGNSEVNYKDKKYSNPEFVPGTNGRNSMHQFAYFLEVQGYPSMYILDKKGELKPPLVGYRTSEQLIVELK